MLKALQTPTPIAENAAERPTRTGECELSSGRARSLYFDLLDEPVMAATRTASRAYLLEQLERAQAGPAEVPDDPDDLFAWMRQNSEEVGRQYRDYLQERRSGGPRRYFGNKSHALYFLKGVAPTKLVDGAWLYGLLERWDHERYRELIRIYLEELGDGIPAKNHVVIYRKLLAAHGCEGWPALSDEHFVQGAVQLSLAHNTAEFLPEVIGFNLGYEQLPLHLLISAYELRELGIDPYYFSLHLTVDNAASGHARRSVQAVLNAMSATVEAKTFYRRVMWGCKLNALGASTLSVIAGFDLYRELVAVLAGKAAVGSQLHSDYCRLEGRTVNEWLADPDRIPAFLESLERSGWIKRHQDPRNSRFWGLIQGERARMFGVFTAYEQQLIFDWIAGDADTTRRGPRLRRLMPEQVDLEERARSAGRGPSEVPAREIFRQHAVEPDRPEGPDEFIADLRALECELAALPDKQALMARLIALMSPARHHAPAGLMASRIFARLLH